VRPERASHLLLFGDFALDSRSLELRRGGTRIRLQPQPAKLLVLLATHAGEVVTRAEIEAALWSKDTFVDFEHGINFAIRQIRDALGDSAERPRYVETLTRVGYRFIGPVEDPSLRGGEPERPPYPGLASFSVEDSPFFFGREAEVESLWRKVRLHPMLALIGASGSGKTSLLRAGLVPAQPAGWKVKVCRPRENAISALRNALRRSAPEGKESGALDDELQELIREWNAPDGGSVLCVDAFEECFTLNDHATRARLCKLLGWAANECGIHVLLCMRDDFLIRCHDHPELAPVFADLTPLRPPQGAALLRLLTEPARKAGYRFEDEALVAEILAGVHRERGALPLLAFAMSRLWEKRDREKRILTRRAYLEVGGVGGAVAHHAEEVLGRLDVELRGVVREIFRNLTSAQRTRVIRDRDELLSVFVDKSEAAGVLAELIEGRLLTSFDVAGDRHPPRPQIEIIHEAMLSSWPRLVRWQAQDADDAVLRDQLHHAAKTWHQRGKRDDLLWTGGSYRELSSWRDRYSGGLTATEESFAQSSRRVAERRRRKMGFAVSSLVAAALTVASVTSSLWRRAQSEARRAEAARLVALGRAELDRFPTAALAYARSSLELVDTSEARRLVLEALWSGPPARILALPMAGVNTWSAEFSSDGRWLATFPFSDKVVVFPDDGGPPVVIDGHEPPSSPPGLAFTADGRALLTQTPRHTGLRMVSIPEGKEICWLAPDLPGGDRRSFEGWVPLPQGVLFSIGAGGAPAEEIHRLELRTCDSQPRILGTFLGKVHHWQADPTGSQLALVREGGLSVRTLAGPPSAPEREIAKVDGSRVRWLRFSPGGDKIATSRSSGELEVWSVAADAGSTHRVFHMPKPDRQFPPQFDAAGSRLAWGSSADASISVWRLDGPPDANPVVLRRPAVRSMKKASFHPDGRFLAAATDDSMTLWDLGGPRAYVLDGHQDRVWHVQFTPDSKWLVSCGRQDGIRVWPLHPENGTVRSLGNPVANCNGLAIDPNGKNIIVGGAWGAHILPLSGGPGRQLMERTPDGGFYGMAFDHTGQRAAGATGYSPRGVPKLLRIWDLRDDSLREIDLVPPGKSAEGYRWGLSVVAFARDGDLLGSGHGGIRSFDPESGESRWIWKTDPERVAKFALSDDGHQLLATSFPFAMDGGHGHQVVHFDLFRGSRDVITNHGDGVTAVAMNVSGTVFVTGDAEGAIRVSTAKGGEPHLLLGHRDEVMAVAVSPDGAWIASAAGSEIRLWPMPDLTERPLHLEPLESLLTSLRDSTNVEAVEDAGSSLGYRLEVGPFPGWKTRGPLPR
jgi:WD40 repeat protein/DNA-binding winged helix-turn-helix (wHTH) protein